MDREKEIEEMAHEIRCLSYCEGYGDNRGCYIAPTCALCRTNRENNADQISKALYNAGYRKQSEVARDLRRYIILNEDIALKCKQENGEKNEAYWKGKLSAFKQIRAYIDAELKKKYTEVKEK